MMDISSRPFVVAAVFAALLVAAPAQAADRPGAGASLGVGVTGYDPSPVAGARVLLPSLEIVAAPAGKCQLRFRTPVLETVYNAVLRHQFLFVLDVFLLFSPASVGGDWVPALRARLGPMVGVRINAGHEVVQPGGRIGGRFGAELMSPSRTFGFFFGIEPLFEVLGGKAGVGRESLTVGGGALFTFAFTGYRKP